MSWEDTIKIMVVPTESEHVEERMTQAEKNDTCDYCSMKPVLKCKKCGQKLCRGHLSVPCV